MVSDFDDSSTVDWCNKGFRRSFPEGIPWDKFKYVTFKFKVTEGVDSVHCLLSDKSGNWWKAIKNGPIAPGEWLQFACKKEDLRFAWSDFVNVTSAEKSADVCEFFISVGTTKVNSNTRIKFEMKNVELGNNAPALITAEAPSAPKTEADLSKPTPFARQWKVSSFNAGGNLVVDGNPFFPLGLYSCVGIDEASGTHKESLYTGGVTEADNLKRFKDIKDAGFNMLQTYTMQFYGMKVSKPGWYQKSNGEMIEDTTPEKIREGTIKFLDLAQKAGLKAIVGGGQPYSLNGPLPVVGREKALDALKQNLKANMTAWKNHPALVAWYLIDEPSTVDMPVQDMQDVYRFMKTQDITHPIFIPSCSAADVKYRYSVDAIGPDPYPVARQMPLHSVARDMDVLKAGQVGNPGMPQIWAVIQICQWVDNIRVPSTEEIRLLSMLALTRDAKGLMFYAHNSYPERNPGQWQDITKAVKSLHTLFPYIMEKSQVLKNYKCSEPRIDSILRKGIGKYTLIAVNSTQNAVYDPVDVGSVTFDLGKLKLPEGTRVRVLDEDPQGNLKLGSQRQISLTRTQTGYVLTDGFGPLASHVYLIELPGAK